MSIKSNLHHIRDVALIAAGVSVVILAVALLVLTLALYPRVSRAITNADQASASAVVVAGHLEIVSADMVAVATVIRSGADRVAQVADHLGDAAGQVRETVGDLRQEYADLDVELGDLSGQMERLREQTDEVDALLGKLGEIAQPSSPLPEAEAKPTSCQLVPEQDDPGQPGAVQLHVEVVVDGLEVPWGLAVLPNGDLLVTERPGRVRLIQAGEIVPEPVLEFGVSILPPLFGQPIAGSEGGLLGLLLHPEFDANRQFYLFYNIDNEDGQSVGRIERYALSADGRSATLDRLIMDDLPAGLHHQGGRMRIGPDGMLYVGVGAYDPPEAQNPDTPAGKLLRMDLDGGIPPDNPDPDSYIFASGIRNTQGYDWFDDRHIVMVDHGPSGFELNMPDLAGYDELNVVTAGDNLGWPRVYGCDMSEGMVSPVLAWEGSVPPTGATFYLGDLIPEWTNSFLFTTVGLNERFTGRPMHGRHLHRVELDPDDPYTIVSHEVYLQNAYGRLRTVVEDADGYLYVMTSNCDNRGECPPEGDKILRIGPVR